MGIKDLKIKDLFNGFKKEEKKKKTPKLTDAKAKKLFLEWCDDHDFSKFEENLKNRMISDVLEIVWGAKNKRNYKNPEERLTVAKGTLIAFVLSPENFGYK